MDKYDLEAVYDAEIAPLMTQIIAICQRTGLPLVASFAYRCDAAGKYNFCSTVSLPPGRIPATFHKIADLLEK